jgi:LacI family transcriptional regulator
MAKHIPKNKEITIYDLAKELGISVATVSRALNNDPVVSPETKKRIDLLAAKWGYRSNSFARNLKKQHTNTIGIMVHELNSSFITSVLGGIERTTAAAGYDLLIAHSSENFEKEIANARNLFHKRVDGLIASLSSETKNLAHFEPYVSKDIPLIFFDRVDEESNMPAVIIDNFAAGYTATKHLAEQGCKRIFHLTSSLSRNVYKKRYEGYRQALADHGLDFDESLILVKDLAEQAAYDAAMQVLQMEHKPDGAFITNDLNAAVFMRTLKSNGWSVPGDIAIVGFNNDTISRQVEPALTTINYPGGTIGEFAANYILKRLRRELKVSTAKTIVQSELVIRESSLRLPGKQS